MFGRLRMFKRLVIILAVVTGAGVPAPIVAAGMPGEIAVAAANPIQNAPSNRVQVSVCLARELVDAWDRPEHPSKMSDFKDAVAIYIQSRRNVRVQYVIPSVAMATFDARNPGALAIEAVQAGQPCPSTTQEYTIPVDPSPDDRPATPVVSSDAGARCNALASSPGDPLAAGGGVPIGEIQIGDAMPVCEAAASARPFNPRYGFLYGRVLEEAKRYSEAATQYAMAA